MGLFTMRSEAKINALKSLLNFLRVLREALRNAVERVAVFAVKKGFFSAVTDEKDWVDKSEEAQKTLETRAGIEFSR